MANLFYIFTKDEFIYVIVIFILGLILGGTLLNLYLSPKIDRLMLEKNDLQLKSEEQQEQIEKLKENLSRQLYINKITIELRTDLNKHTQQDISNKIREMLSGLMSLEVKNIEPLLLRDAINDRYVPVGDKNYHIQLDFFVIINEELQLYITVNSSNTGQEKE